MPDAVAFVETNILVDETAETVSIPLIRTGDLIGPLTVTYDITSSSAVGDEDFSGAGGTVTIPAGADSAVIEAALIDDAVAEDANPDVAGTQPEAFGVSIVSVAGGEVGVPRSSNVFIVDDESPAPLTPPPSVVEPAFTAREEVVAPGVENAVAIEWLPTDPDLMVIAEKSGTVRVYDTAAETFRRPLVDLSDEVNNTADRGFIDLAFHPDFAEIPKVYMTYTVDPPEVADNPVGDNAGPDGEGNRFNWLVSFDVDTSGRSPRVIPASKEILVGGAARSLDDVAGAGELDFTDVAFDDAAAFPASDIDPVTGEPIDDFWKMDSLSHVGGGLAFGPGGALFVGTGDGTSFNYDDPRSIGVQDTDTLSGKILRIDPLTGEGDPRNPFYTGDPDDNASKVFQLGLRNPYRITFDDDGQLFISNTGWFSWEEIESGGRGANFGWPLFEGADEGLILPAPGYSEQPGTAAFYDAFESGELEITPAYRGFSHTPGESELEVDGLVGADSVYQGDRYPAALQGDYFFFDISNPGAVYSVDTDEPDSLRKLFEQPAERAPIVMKEGPDGYMYFGDFLQDFVGRWRLEAGSRDNRFEAEEAVTRGTVAVGATHPGFSGDGFADFGTTRRDAVTWTVEVPEAGAYDLVFGYANGGSTEDRSLILLVDGERIGRLPFEPTGNFFTWAEETTRAPLDLPAGDVTVRLRSDGGDGPNIDYVDLVPTDGGGAGGGGGGGGAAPPALIFGLEAEEATLGGGVRARDVQPGFSGTGYADFGFRGRDFVEWTVDIPEAGFYDLVFTYANGAPPTGDRSQLLRVDGAPVDVIDFATTGTWSDWDSEAVGRPLRLDAGTHTVQLDSNGGPGPNVDFLDVVVADTDTAAARYEAELAARRGGVERISVNSPAFETGYSGNGYADFGTSRRDALTWTVDVPETGRYELAFGYANGGATEDRSLILQVDGERVERLPFETTGLWSDWAEQPASGTIRLTEGEHTVRLRSDGGEGPNVDYLELTPFVAGGGGGAGGGATAGGGGGAGTASLALTLGREAEDAVLGGSVAARTERAGFDGTGYAAFGADDADFVEWTIEVAETGLYEVAFGYAADAGDGGLALRVGDDFVERLAFAETADWAEQAASAPIALTAGTNTIRLDSDGGDGPDVDFLTLEFVDTPV